MPLIRNILRARGDRREASYIEVISTGFYVPITNLLTGINFKKFGLGVLFV
jgi:hypothetical protein